VHEGRAVYLGQRSGFYELAGSNEGAEQNGAPATNTAFAANLLDADESTIEPAKELVVGDKKAGTLSGFQIGVRREIWIYLLLAAILLTAVEWITYHRRITV
jgi:hypothetical protein